MGPLEQFPAQSVLLPKNSGTLRAEFISRFKDMGLRGFSSLIDQSCDRWTDLMAAAVEIKAEVCKREQKLVVLL